MITLSPQDVYNRLLNDDKILTQKGQIKFYLGNVNIIVKQKDVVGNIIQEWLEGWLKKNKIRFSSNPNSQMPPDIFLNPEDKTTDLLEVKAFNYEATPGFDIADFKSYQEEIIKEPYMLHTKYIIFGYVMTSEGVVLIKKMWLQNVWEICRTSNKWPINVQYKNGIVHKIRPAKWYSNAKSIQYRPFESLEDYLAAIEETVYQNPDTRDKTAEWKQRMRKSYKNFYGKNIDIPRWIDIKTKYENTKEQIENSNR